LLILRGFTIRNQQVAGSIPAGGSIYLVLNQSITDQLQVQGAGELPGAGTQPAHRNLDCGGASGVKLLENTEWGQFRSASESFELVSSGQ
jgi:hypothetical protein